MAKFFMDFSPSLEKDQKIKRRIKYGIASLLAVGFGINCKSELNACEETRFLINKIRLDQEKGNRRVTIAGELENIGGSWGDSNSECHFNLFIDKARVGYTPIRPIRVLIRFNGYNDLANSRGEKYNAIVTGILKKSDDKYYDYIIAPDQERNVDVGFRRMWLINPLQKF